jgi:hypothetical protein
VLEFLAKEAVINCGATARKQKSIRAWPTFSGIVNKITSLENEIFIRQGPDGNILLELNRIAHRQFAWQSNPPHSTGLMRYLRIFEQPEINEISLERLGISVRNLVLCGMAFLGAFMSRAAVTLPIPITTKGGLSHSDFDCFLRFACRPLKDMKRQLTSEQIYDTRFIYAFSSLRAYPLIRSQLQGPNTIICPIPTLLFWRITSGLYYALYQDPRFGDLFGKSFQTYVGEVIARTNHKQSMRLIKEQRYGPRAVARDSVDWILHDRDFAVFLECKAKRPSWGAKMAIDDVGPIETDIDYLASGVVQTYRAITDYRNDRYPHFPYEPNRVVRPAIVTLESWHMFGPKLPEMLRDAVIKKLNFAMLPTDIVDEAPYSVISVLELEAGMQFAAEVGLRDYWQGKLDDPEMRQWDWQAYNINKFRGLKVRKLFEDEYRDLFNSFGA